MSLNPIPIKLPPSFEEALGYKGGRKYVAFYWEPAGDEAMYHDGYCTAECNWWAFVQFVRHPKVYPWLKEYNFGNSDEDAIHWMLCDLSDRTLSVGTRVEVETFLLEQIRLTEPPSIVATKRLEPEDFQDIIKQLNILVNSQPVPTYADLQAVMEQARIAVDNMVNELNKGEQL